MLNASGGAYVKFQLLSDDVGFEPLATQLMSKIVGGVSPIFHSPEIPSDFSATEIDINRELGKLTEKSNVLLAPISTLLQHHKIASIIKLIHSLKTSKRSKQVFTWATLKNIKDKTIVAFLEHMADVVVTISSKKTLAILIKKHSGSITRKVKPLKSLHASSFK